MNVKKLIERSTSRHIHQQGRSKSNLAAEKILVAGTEFCKVVDNE